MRGVGLWNSACIVAGLIAFSAAPALGGDRVGAARPADGSFDIVITVDDLPVHGRLPQGVTREQIARAHIAALKAHHVPEAFGFVNGSRVIAEPDSEVVLQIWREAGYPLGNHGSTHLNLERAATLGAWEADVKAGEPLVAKYMKNGRWHWYRFPNLAAGSTKERHEGAANYLKQQHYSVAHVTAAFSDWSYTDAYVRCRDKHDDAPIAAMKAAYLKAVDDGIVRMKEVSRRVYGRVVPQVLLTHVGAWSALTLPDVLARLDAAGARYVRLSDAQRDPAFAEAAQLLGGGSIVDRTAHAKQVDLSGIVRPKNFDGLVNICR